MQYILTQAEFDELNRKREHELKMSKAKLQKLCSKISNEMPIKFWGNKEARPWGCGLDPKDADEGYDEFYCDECPVQDICPNDHKHWSQ